MPGAICVRSKSGVPHNERGAFKIAAKANFNLRLGNGKIPLHSPREHHVAPAADRVASCNRKGGTSLAIVFDYIVLIASGRGRGTAQVMTGERQPCFEMLRNGERMEQTTRIRPNIKFEVNRRAVRCVSFVDSSKLRTNSRGALRAGEAEAWLHIVNTVCNRISSRETSDRFVTKF